MRYSLWLSTASLLRVCFYLLRQGKAGSSKFPCDLLVGKLGHNAFSMAKVQRSHQQFVENHFFYLIYISDPSQVHIFVLLGKMKLVRCFCHLQLHKTQFDHSFFLEVECLRKDFKLCWPSCPPLKKNKSKCFDGKDCSHKRKTNLQM